MMGSKFSALAFGTTNLCGFYSIKRHPAGGHVGEKHAKTWPRRHPVYSVIAWLCFQTSIIGVC